MRDSKKAMMDATIDIVAEMGLEGLTTKKVTDRAGLSGAMIYQHFESKEALVYECFLDVDREIAGVFEGSELPEDHSRESVLAYIKEYWEKYFRFMVQNGNRTLFYYAYCESADLKKMLESDTAIAKELQEYASFFSLLMKKSGLSNQLDERVLWTLLIDGTGVFVKRIIKGEIPFDQNLFEQYWQILMYGFSSFSE